MYRTVPVILAVIIVTAMIGVSVSFEQAFASSAASAAAEWWISGSGSSGRR